MIDTHCHLLPGIDDGPRTEADSIELARRLWEQGVRSVVCTPHVSRRHQPTGGVVESRREHLERSLRTLGVGLHLTAAGELSGGFALNADPDAVQSWSLGERHLLVEVPRDAGPSFFEDVCRRLPPIGLTPVFAHPERSVRVQRDVRLLDSFREAGALVQVVAPSLRGSPGSGVYRTAWELLERGSADIVASDAHRAAGVLSLSGVLGLIEQRLGRAALRQLTVDAPGRLLGEVVPAG